MTRVQGKHEFDTVEDWSMRVALSEIYLEQFFTILVSALPILDAVEEEEMTGQGK